MKVYHLNGEVSFVSAIYGTLDDIRIGAQVNSKLGYIYDYPIEDIIFRLDIEIIKYSLMILEQILPMVGFGHLSM